MPLSFYGIAALALAGPLVLALLKLKYGNDCSGSYQPRATTEATVSEMVFSNLEAEARGQRAMALMCASVCWRGDPTDTEGLLSVADEFLQYIQGDNAVMPRPDAQVRGQMPKAGKR
jgi:hypothetical protein